MKLNELVKQMLQECKVALKYAQETKNLPDGKLTAKSEKGKKRYYAVYKGRNTT